MRIAGAALAYFAIVFAVGFVLGTLRVLWLAPALGERVAELAELPLMVLASAWAARWIGTRLRVPHGAGPRLAIGAIALALLLVLEFGVVLALRGLTLEAYLATRDPVSGTAYALSLLAFALWPWWFGRRTGPRP
ncbi:MAG: hypothetical protein LW860_16710 [Xanthomonadaceae bacterium]|jgi:hypothetical protein|nr:hypothetical protein [Xanthomonadaceae bacterium]